MTQASLALSRGRLAARRRRGGRSRLALATSVVVAGALLSPLLFLALDARSAGWSEIHRVLFRSRSLVLLRNTVVLSLLVVVLSATVGVAAAWWVERRSVPGRRIWTVLLVLPVAVPDFVISYAWHSAAPGIDPLVGATLVMTLGTYPLVFLPAVAALRRADPAMEDVAHSLGVTRSGTFLRVTAPLLRTAVLGGSVLVVLTVLSEYGAFEILRYQTF
ncbi:MAG TPA: ABC transporter permease subunit, partial [Acidimicrobiales bacterium]|nr:ABC transporter permease subunit [Acidimicrobiales bacterium]